MKFNILDLAFTRDMSGVLSHFKAAFAPNYVLDPKLAGLCGDCVAGTYLSQGIHCATSRLMVRCVALV